MAHLGGAQPGAAKSGGDKLWEDNWDDDDIEDEFSVQLRYELLSTSWAFITIAHYCLISGMNWRRRKSLAVGQLWSISMLVLHDTVHITIRILGPVLNIY